jgi:hypothetical protein
MAGQLTINSGSQRLVVGSYYTVGGNSEASTIQASDFYSSLDHGKPLLLNPLGGNVGIGCNAPAYQLDVSGTLHATGITTLGSTLDMCNNNISNVGTVLTSNVGSNGGNIAFDGSGVVTITPNYTLAINLTSTNGNINVTGNNLNVNAALNMCNNNISNVSNVTASNVKATFGRTITSGTTVVSPLAAYNGDINSGSNNLAQIEFQYYDGGGYTHYIGSRHDSATGAVTGNAIDFYICSNATGTAGASSAPNSGNVRMMSVTAVGVGINTSAPAYTLDVNGNASVKANGSSTIGSYATSNDTLTLLSTCNAYAGAITSIFFGNNTTNCPLARIYAQDTATGGGAFRSRLVFQTSLGNEFSLDERMRIESNGYVGVLTTSPTAPLEVATIIPGSIYLNNAGAGYVRSTNTNNTATDFGSGDFTIEFWVNPTTTYPGNWTTWFSAGVQTGEIRISQNNGNSGFIGFSYPANVHCNSTVAPTLNTWNHLALVRIGSTMQLYFGGTRIVNITGVSFTFNNTGYIWLGYNPYGDTIPNTHIGGLRIAKSALYASGATITVPSAPLLPIASTSLLMNMYIGAPLYDSTNNTAFSFFGNCYQTSLIPNGTYNTTNTALVNGTLCVSNYTPQTTTSSNGSISIVGRMPTLGGEYAEGAVSTTYTISNYGGGVYGGLTQNVGSYLAFSTITGNSTVERMRIKDSGNVGIGTSTPSYALDVTGDTQVGRSSGNSFLNVKSGASNIQLFKNGALGGLYESDNGRMNLTTNGNTDNGISVKGASSLVGINCNDPQYTLDVNGTSRISSNLGVGVAPLGTAGSVNVSDGYYVGGVKQPIPARAWTPVLTNVAQSGQTFTKNIAGDEWNSQVYSTEGYPTAYASFCAGTTSGYAMMGLNTDPATNADHATIDYAWYADFGTAAIYENGTPIGIFSAYTLSTVFQIIYDGVNVRYFLDGVVQRTVARALGSNLYLDSSIYTSGASFTNVVFGPFNGEGLVAGSTTLNNVLTAGPPGVINGNSNLTFNGTSLGINCNAPAYKLDVSGNMQIYEATGTAVTNYPGANTIPTGGVIPTDGSLTLRHGNAGGQSSIVFRSATNSGSDYGYITYMDDVSNRSGGELSRLLIGTQNDPAVGAAQDATVIQPFGGFAGIGQMNPAYELDVTGTTRATTSVIGGTMVMQTWVTNGAYASLGNSTTIGTGDSYALLQHSTGQTFLNSASGYALSLRTGNSDRIFIRSDGLVGINTGSPVSTTHIQGKASDITGGYGALLVDYSNVGGQGASVTIRNSGGGTGAFAALVFEVDGSTAISAGSTPIVANQANGYIYCRNAGAGAGNDASTMGFQLWSGGAENEVMTLVGSNQRVGINTTAPAYTLDVSGNTRVNINGSVSTTNYEYGAGYDSLTIQSTIAPYSGGISSIAFTNTGMPMGRIYCQDAQPTGGAAYLSRMVFQTNASGTGVALAERMRIDANGYVGINCNAPAYTLDVNGGVKISSNTAGVNYLILSNASTNTSSSRIQFYGGGGGGVAGGIDLFPYYGSLGGQINFRDNGYGSTFEFSNGEGSANPTLIERFRIGTNGNIGINQPAPVGQLHVKTSGDAISGNVWGSTWMVVTSAANSATSYNTPALGFGYSVACNTSYITSLEPNVDWRNLELGGSNIVFKNNGTERVRITEAGNVGIGTNGPGYILDVNGRMKADGFSLGSSVGDSINTAPSYGMGIANYSILGIGVATHLQIAHYYGVSITAGNTTWDSNNPTAVFGNQKVGINMKEPVTTLDVNGGLTVRNGIRPLYSKVSSGTSITPAANSYGTHYDIQTSAITGLTISYPAAGSNNWSNDSNAYWVFRNNTGTSLSLTISYTAATPNIYPSNITIAPETSVTLMATYPGGVANSNYVLF